MIAQTAAKPESLYLCGVFPLIQQSKNKQRFSPSHGQLFSGLSCKLHTVK